MVLHVRTIQINTWCEGVEDETQSMEEEKLIRIFALSRNMAVRPGGTSTSSSFAIARRGRGGSEGEEAGRPRTRARGG